MHDFADEACFLPSGKTAHGGPAVTTPRDPEDVSGGAAVSRKAVSLDVISLTVSATSAVNSAVSVLTAAIVASPAVAVLT